MSRVVNVLIAISSTARTLIRERLMWDSEEEYTGPVTDLEYKIFRRMADLRQTENMWKTPTIAGKTWRLFSLSFDASAQAKTALDWIAANRANHFHILGAYRHDNGLQVGLSYVYDEDGNRTYTETTDDDVITRVYDITGTPVYEQHAALLSFMPDIIEYDSEGIPTGSTPATELRQINTRVGQANRIFN